MPTKHSEDGAYKFSMDFLREAENHCVLQSPIPIMCPIRLIHGLKDEDVPWHISMLIQRCDWFDSFSPVLWSWSSSSS